MHCGIFPGVVRRHPIRANKYKQANILSHRELPPRQRSQRRLRPTQNPLSRTREMPVSRVGANAGRRQNQRSQPGGSGCDTASAPRPGSKPATRSIDVCEGHCPASFMFRKSEHGRDDRREASSRTGKASEATASAIGTSLAGWDSTGSMRRRQLKDSDARIDGSIRPVVLGRMRGLAMADR